MAREDGWGDGWGVGWGRPRARDRDVGAGHLADVLEEQVADAARGRVRAVGLPLRVEHLVAQGVEHARDAGPDAPRAQHLAVHLGGGRQRRRRDAGPLAGERAVEEAGEVDLVDVDPARGQAAERRLDPEADDPHLPVLVDQHVLGRQAAVGEAGVVGLDEAVGDLGHQPGRTSGGERSLAGEQDVEGVALAPLVDDEAAPVGGLGVEDPQQPPVDDGPGAARRLEERLGAVVVRGEDVHGHRAVEDEVVGTPEPTRPGLGEEVVEAVAPGEHVTRLHRHRHRSPHLPRLSHC